MDAFLCSYWDEVGRGDVTDCSIRSVVIFSPKALKYPEGGISLQRMDTHSLWSRGAYALELAWFKGREIMIMGPWAPKSQAFMEYIQQQLPTFSAGMSTTMSNVVRFINMEGSVEREDLRRTTNILVGQRPTESGPSVIKGSRGNTGSVLYV